MHAGLEDLRDGETLARLRVLDWSQRRSRVAMHLWWGPHRVLLYNDAATAAEDLRIAKEADGPGSSEPAAADASPRKFG